MLLPLDTRLGAPAATLSASIQAGFLAFRMTALLYLITEELFVKAHETPDRPWVTAMFFAGVLLLLLLDEAVGQAAEGSAESLFIAGAITVERETTVIKSGQEPSPAENLYGSISRGRTFLART